MMFDLDAPPYPEKLDGFEYDSRLDGLVEEDDQLLATGAWGEDAAAEPRARIKAALDAHPAG